MNKRNIIAAKILNIDTIQHLCNAWRLKNEKIVFTNGCFDLLHRGHIELLAEAASYGNKLIVGINSDQSVKRLKGIGRPIQDETARSLLLASQLFVDVVCVFDTDTPLELIQAVSPDVLIKGGDYEIENIVGADFVKEYGGSVLTIPYIEGYSTTSLIEKLKHTD
jgi:rfaE bifunctional protein nucleotidyltransferase chain/domain